MNHSSYVESIKCRLHWSVFQNLPYYHFTYNMHLKLLLLLLVCDSSFSQNLLLLCLFFPSFKNCCCHHMIVIFRCLKLLLLVHAYLFTSNHTNRITVGVYIINMSEDTTWNDWAIWQKSILTQLTHIYNHFIEYAYFCRPPQIVMIESILNFDIEHPIYRFFDWINGIINKDGAHLWGRQAIYQFVENLSKRHSNLVIQSRFVFVCILVCGCAYTGISGVRSRCENWSYWIDQSQDGHKNLLTHYDN